MDSISKRFRERAADEAVEAAIAMMLESDNSEDDLADIFSRPSRDTKLPGTNFFLTDFKGPLTFRTVPTEVNPAMKTFYRFSRGLLYLFADSEYPYDAAIYVKKSEEGTSNIDDAPRAFAPLVGTFIWLAFLAFLMLIFFICHVLCCLCFNKCCPRTLRTQRMPPERTVYLISFLVILIGGFFGLVAMCLVLSSMYELTRNSIEATRAVHGGVQDIIAYVDHFTDNTNHIFVNMNETKDALDDKFKYIGNDMGGCIKKKLDERTQYQSAVDYARSFNSEIESMHTTMKSLDNNFKRMETLSTSMLAPGRTKPFKAPDTTNELKAMEKIEAINFAKKVDEGMVEINNIPKAVEQATRFSIEDINANWEEEQFRLSEFQTDVLDVKTKTKEQVINSSIYKKLPEWTDKMVKEKNANEGYFSLILVVQLFFALCICLGAGIVAVGYHRNHQRLNEDGTEELGCLTVRTGGCIIWIGVVLFSLIAIWTSIMAISILLLMVGYDIVICQAVDNPAFIDGLLEKHNVLGEHPGGSYFSTQLMKVPYNTTFATILGNCEADMTLYRAVELDKLSYVSNFIEKLDLVLANVDAIRRLLQSNVEVKRLFVLSQLDEYFKEVDKLQATFNFSSWERALDTDENHMFDALPEFQDVENLAKQDINKMKASSELVALHKPYVMGNLSEAEKKVANDGPAASREGTTLYSNEINSILETFVKKTRHDIFHAIGRCRPLYDLYQTVVVHSVCTAVTQPGNGLWVALGCLHFCLVHAIILAKLLVYLTRKEKPKIPKIKVEKERPKEAQVVIARPLTVDAGEQTHQQPSISIMDKGSQTNLTTNLSVLNKGQQTDMTSVKHLKYTTGAPSGQNTMQGNRVAPWPATQHLTATGQ